MKIKPPRSGTTDPTPPAPPYPPNAPYVSGDSSGNVPLGFPSGRCTWAGMRMVARKTGTLTKIHHHVKTAGAGYHGGTGGVFTFWFAPIQGNGDPNLAGNLYTTTGISWAGLAIVSQALGAGVAVTKGTAYAAIWKNTDAAPGTNYDSLNFIYNRATGASGSGPTPGANGRNETSAGALDVYLGLDPREVVVSSADGTTWQYPANAYLPYAFVPAYVQEYGTGEKLGQPYYSSGLHTGAQVMRWPVAPRAGVAWTISHIGLYLETVASGAQVQLEVNSVVTDTLTINGGPGMVRAQLPTPRVATDLLVRILYNADTLPIRSAYADAAMSGIIGLGSTYRWYQESSTQRAAAVYPIPSPYTD